MMKRFIWLCTALVAVGCSSGGGSGGGACDGSLALGTWALPGNVDVMTFAGNCGGTSSYCASTFTVSKAVDATGVMTVTTNTTNNASGCAPVGQMQCAYAISSTTLDFDCGNGVQSYTKQ